MVQEGAADSDSAGHSGALTEGDAVDADTPADAEAGASTVGANSPLLPILAITAAALVLRLVALGGRIFHWDEGRVAYWILRFDATGEYFYRPIIHGPFLPIVNGFLFDFLPPTDFSARLPVAVVGGLLPLFAWLIRDRLNRTEAVSLALLLAFNPLLVYYSRFMRSDVLVGGFSLLALGLVVRAVDARRPGYLVPAGAVFALGFTAKENALIYLVCFLGAGFLLLDHRLVGAVWSGQRLKTTAVDLVSEIGRRLVHWADEGNRRRRGLSLVLSPVGAVVAFFAVIVFFYAPRPDVWQMLSDPGMVPAVLHAATVESWNRFYELWAAGGHQGHDYLPYLHDLLETLVYGAPVLLALAPIGFAIDGYSEGRFRDLVAFTTYVGAVSIIGYPIATDIQAPWVGVHVVLPLSVPAAVGLAYLIREASVSIDREDAVGAALAVLLLVGLVGGVAYLNVDYFNSAAEEDKQILQWAQPHNDLRESLEKVEVVARQNEGTDVLFYGTTSSYGDTTLLYVENESSALGPPPGGPAWHSRLPLPWYLERYGATVDSTPPEADPATVAADAPPVIFAHTWDRDELDPHLDGYTASEHGFKLWGEKIVVYIDDSALEQAHAAS